MSSPATAAPARRRAAHRAPPAADATPPHRSARPQPRLGPGGLIGGDPRDADVPAEIDVVVSVYGPAVHRAAARGGMVHQLRMLPQRRDGRADGGGPDRGGGAAAEVAGRDRKR